MPSPTFFNLPEVKRQAITELAIAEFANSDYASASISNLVKQAKIAKGSFYQYFEDKKDLYLYLLDQVTQQKIAYIQAHTPAEVGFFVHLRALLSTATRFDLEQPQLSRLIYRAVFGDLPFREEVLQQTQAATHRLIQPLIATAIERGEIAADINPAVAMFVISVVSNGLKFLIPAQLGISAEALAREGAQALDMDKVEPIFDDLIRILERGLAGR